MICALENYFIVLHATLSSTKKNKKIKKKKGKRKLTLHKNSFNLAFSTINK